MPSGWVLRVCWDVKVMETYFRFKLNMEIVGISLSIIFLAILGVIKLVSKLKE